MNQTKSPSLGKATARAANFAWFGTITHTHAHTHARTHARMHACTHARTQCAAAELAEAAAAAAAPALLIGWVYVLELANGRFYIGIQWP